jgi:hypothetical protein
VIQLSLDQLALEFVEGALAEEQDGKQLKRELGEQLKLAVEPALPIIRGELMTMGGTLPASPPLRTSVIGAMSTKVRYSGAAPGVRVAISRKGMPRGFTDAARRINRGSWSHPVYGRSGSSVTQQGVEGFFDRPLEDRVDEMRRGVEQAVEAMAQRIASRSSG